MGGDGSGALTRVPPGNTFLTQAELDVYVSEFSRTGFTGGFNWYRAADLNADEVGMPTGPGLNIPSMMITAENDLILRPEMAAHMPALIPGHPNGEHPQLRALDAAGARPGSKRVDARFSEGPGPMTDAPERKPRKAEKHADGRVRCAWCEGDPLMVAYHDEEWGRPLHDDQRLFELLCLEGAQAGLSWRTILHKREHYRKAFDGFDPKRMARYNDAKKARLLANPGIVRNRLKVDAFISNARAYLELLDAGRSFDDYLWQFTDGKVIRNRFRTLSEFPVSTPQSDAMSKDLKKKGFKFIGTTICYAFMQASGRVDDHQRGCWVADAQ